MRLFYKNKSAGSLKAVYEDDLMKYLESVGLLSEIEAGRVLCKYCGNPITLENLEVIVPNQGEIEVVCNNKNCLNQL